MKSLRRKHRKHALGPISRLLLCGAVIAGGIAAQTGPQPGATDPVGVGHLNLFPDDEIFSFSPDAPNEAVNGRIYRTDTSTNLSLVNATLYGTLTDGPSNPTVAASGRVLQPDHANVVEARRVPGTSTVEVGAYADQPAYWYFGSLADRTKGADLIAIASGDVDKALDSLDNYRDEIVLAYALGDGSNNLRVQVMNFTSGQMKPANLDVPLPDSSQVIACDNPLALAIGDFDNDGKNEIALAYAGSAGISVTVFRYTSNGQGSGSLSQVNSTVVPVVNFIGVDNPFHRGLPAQIVIDPAKPVATVALQAGDFNGDGADELAIGYAVAGVGKSSIPSGSVGASLPVLSVVRYDSSFNPTLAGQFAQQAVALTNSLPTTRVELASGQFLFDATQHPFGVHQVAVGWNDPQNNAIDIRALALSSDLATATPIGSTVYAQTDPSWPGTLTQQFSLVAGGFTGNANIHSPTASLAVSAWTANGGGGVYWIRTIAVDSGGLAFADLRSFATGPVDSLQRFPIVATDWDGKSVYLGAPVRIPINNATRTNYILEEPPSHTYWDKWSEQKQVQTVSRYTGLNTSYSNSTSTSQANTSKDHSSWNIGGSAQVSAGIGFKAGADLVIAKGEVTASVDVTAKAGYDYNRNQDSYNSTYSKRDLTITAKTDLDDYVNYNIQTFDVWRYRMYGVAQVNPDTNSFYEIVLPGPALTQSLGGLDTDWYQPIHENGNILSYPQSLNADQTNRFMPSDLGAFKLADGTSLSQPLIPASQLAFDGVSQSEALEITNTISSGGSIDYSNTLAESLDVKASASATADVGGVEDTGTVSGDVEFHNSNSWGNTSTSDNNATTDTTIAVNVSSGNPNQSYFFYPVLYIAQDGTMKMRYTVDNPAGASGSGSFWADLYGAKPDPAVNLPRRFNPAYSVDGVQTGWTPEQSILRKKMRGLFFRKPTINPANNDYDYLNANATDGDTVRVEARVYNYSTAQAASNIPVAVQVIPYDSALDSETCKSKPINGSPGDTSKLVCPVSDRTTVGTVTIPRLNALQATCLAGTDDNPNATGCYDGNSYNNNTAGTYVNWNTSGFGPATGGASTYRVYWVLNPGKYGLSNQDETYGADGEPVAISSITNAEPMVVTTSAPHGLETGYYVTIGQVSGLTEANAVWQIKVDSPTTFELVNSVPGAADYAGGGTATLLDPGQNNEGYGTLSIQAKSSGLQSGRGPSDDYLKARSIQALDLRTGKVTAGSVTAYQFRPVQVEVTVYSTDAHARGTRLLLYDGNPAQGAAVIADELVHPGSNGANGTTTQISWTPKTLGAHRLYAQLLEQTNDTNKGNNTATLTVNVFRNGDVNADGQINRADLNEVLQNVGKQANRCACGPACDLNGDGVISVLDVRQLVLICGEACRAQ